MLDWALSMGLGRIHELGHAKCRLIINEGLSWTEDLISNGDSLAASSLVMAMSAGSRRFGWDHSQLQAAVEKVADLLSPKTLTLNPNP